MYGWSKWGGATHGLSKETLDEWYCQVCGELQVKVFPSYMMPLDDFRRDFARVCTRCKAKAVNKKIDLMYQLIKMIKGV